MQAANYLIKGNDKYIQRYPETDLVKILKDSGYHSEEWEETDPEEDWPTVQPAVIENDMITKEAVKKKSLSIYIYERWWRSSEVFIILMFYFISFKLLKKESTNSNFIYLSFDDCYMTESIQRLNCLEKNSQL